jgi:hypothetical protein
MNVMAEQPDRDHERKDADVISIFLIVLALFVCGAVIFLTLWFVMHSFRLRDAAKRSGEEHAPAVQTQNFPQPRLEIGPGATLAELRAAEDVDLNSYGWVDRNAGIVRTPIDRAMQLLLERGLPDVGAAQTPLSLSQARPHETASPPRLMQKP